MGASLWVSVKEIIHTVESTLLINSKMYKVVLSTGKDDGLGIFEDTDSILFIVYIQSRQTINRD